MHLIRQHGTGGPEVLQHTEVADLEPGPGQVRVAVAVAGVHLVDTSIRAGTFGGPGGGTPPEVPGREVAGRVDLLGDGVDAAWLGRRVVAHLGLVGGGYASQAVTDADRLHVVPDGLALDVAVAAIGTGRTATGILDLAPVSADDRVVVTAASGGLGTVLVRAAVSAGAAVVGLGNGGWKTEVVRALGVDAVDTTTEGWTEEVASRLGGPPTIAFDGVGGEVARALHGLLAPAGVLVTYTGSSAADFPGGAEVRPVLGPALTGRPGGLRSLEEESLARAADGSRVPVVGTRFALADAAEAHRALEGRRTVGKVVLVVRPDELG